MRGKITSSGMDTMTNQQDLSMLPLLFKLNSTRIQLKTLSMLCILMTAMLLGSGCSKSTNPDDAEPADTSQPAVSVTPQMYEASAEQLLAARLPASEAAEGWIRLFDGHTLYGWEITGAANWRVEDGKIVVDSGAACLLCTSMPWQDYELIVEYKADAETNSGVFLRTPLEPEDPELDCYEVNIAPNDNPFPTAGIVKRKKANAIEGDVDHDAWHTMEMVMDGKNLKVSVDGTLLCDYTDPIGLDAGRIGLQHNSGHVEFRNIRLRPLGMKDLLDADLSQWTKYPDMPGDFSINDDGQLHVQGGRTQLESKDSFADFLLLSEYKLPTAEMNSGIFFRCIPGDEMMGYECQISNQTKEGNPLMPADHGTGGIFKRQDARLVAGDVDDWSTVLLVASGPTMAAWVQGIQVSNWYDDREPNENPRRGLRTEAGTLMIQGHDKDTDALLKQIKVAILK